MEKGGTPQDQRELYRNVSRIADSLEKLASDPDVEIEAGPALCPHCGQFNPTVTVTDTEGSGTLSEWVLVAECHHCNHTFYGIVESWSMYVSTAALESDVDERKRAVNGNE